MSIALLLTLTNQNYMKSNECTVLQMGKLTGVLLLHIGEA